VSALVGWFVDLRMADLPQNLLDGALRKVHHMRARALRMAGRVVKNRARMRMLIGLLVASEDDPNLRATVAENLTLVRSIIARFFGKDPKDPEVEIAFAMFIGIGIQHLMMEDTRPTPMPTACSSVWKTGSATLRKNVRAQRASRSAAAKTPRAGCVSNCSGGSRVLERLAYERRKVCTRAWLSAPSSASSIVSGGVI
jgi:hypothetical protein